MSGDIYFLSDAHIGLEEEKTEVIKQEKLISFIRGLKGKAEVLYIVGDLFDFWFEYKTVVPKRGLKVLFELERLIESGTRVVYIAGNHDLWGDASTVGSFLSDEIGIEFSPDPVDVCHHSLKIHIAHGDGLSGSRGDRIVKWILKNPTCIRLFRVLHPDLGNLVAKLVSKTSRDSRPPTPDLSPDLIGGGSMGGWNDFKDIYVQAAEDRLQEGFDVVVFGHLHIPLVEDLECGTLVILGDWIRHFTYGILQDGKISLRQV